MGERNRVVDEDGKTPATTNRTISTDESKIRENWLFGAGREFRLLEAGDFNRVFDKKCRKFSNRVLQAVDVELEHVEVRVKRRSGARVRVDTTNEEKNED